MDTRRIMAGVGVIAIVVTLGAACGSSYGDAGTATDESATGDPTTQTAATGPTCPDAGDEFESARLYIEHNATDADTGVHGIFGAEGWQILCITTPDGRRILEVTPEGPLGALGLADVFFESREPENVDYPIADLMADFPEGDYEIGAVDFEGNDLVATARFTHAIPVEPEITSPTLADDAETADDVMLPATGFVVEWAPVTDGLDGEAVDIVGYELIVTDEEYEDPDDLARPVYDVHVGPEVDALAIPEGFLVPGRIYEVEVLALEESGNQTITIGFFVAS